MNLAAYYPRLAVSVEPTSEPVTLAEFKVFAQYEDSDQDALITSLLKAARRKVERDCDISLITQTRVMKLDAFPCGDSIEIHMHPVTAVAVSYLDTAGASQTFSSGSYSTDFINLPPRIVLNDGVVWPETQTVANAATVTITTGYASATAVPDEAKLALLLLAREWFYGRCASGEVGDGVTMAYGALCHQLRWRPL